MSLLAPSPLPEQISSVLRNVGLRPDSTSADTFAASTLDGGVSSSVWRVETHEGPVCVKQPLARLKVAALWEAPLERAALEARWLELAWQLDHDAAPRVVGFDAEAHVLVLEWLEPSEYPVWKTQLLAGEVDPRTAEVLGARLGAWHRFGAGVLADPAARPVWDDATQLFEALRLHPYLITAAERVPAVAPVLLDLVTDLRERRTTIIHGDVSPKNVLVGPRGPVLLDAECACAGDPAFDIAFLLNHLLLKAVHLPDTAPAFRNAANVCWAGYRNAAADAAATGAMVGRLLPALALARVDGRSPVEYLDDDAREIVRNKAIEALINPASTTEATIESWFEQ